jgi:hypothetical protein
MCARFDFEAAATRLDMRMTIDGSGDEQICIEGVDSYSFCDADGGDSGCESEEEAQQEEQQEEQRQEGTETEPNEPAVSPQEGTDGRLADEEHFNDVAPTEQVGIEAMGVGAADMQLEGEDTTLAIPEVSGVPAAPLVTPTESAMIRGAAWGSAATRDPTTRRATRTSTIPTASMAPTTRAVAARRGGGTKRAPKRVAPAEATMTCSYRRPRALQRRPAVLLPRRCPPSRHRVPRPRQAHRRRVRHRCFRRRRRRHRRRRRCLRCRRRHPRRRRRHRSHRSSPCLRRRRHRLSASP